MQHAVVTLIRHAETTGNLNRLLQGITDSPLTVFGQAQVDALAQAWKTTTTPNSTLNLPPPTLIVCSPVGRARKTAEAIHAACAPLSTPAVVLKANAPRFASLPVRQDVLLSAKPETLPLVVDFGLAEKDFGSRESTRGGVHVAGFPKGHGVGESKADFAAKVHSVGQEWLQAAAASANVHPPHIVLVTHGMWIATFLSASPTLGSAPPFAANTGIFSLKVSLNDSNKLVTELFKINDTRHLDSVKRQKGGFGRVAFDPAQTKLSSFFTKPAAKDGDESLRKKRKI